MQAAGNRRARSRHRLVGASQHGRESMLATQRHPGVRSRNVPMTLIGVHRGIDYGAHRLPAGKTAAKERRRGRPASQATKQIEDRQLLLSKAFASFVMTAEF